MIEALQTFLEGKGYTNIYLDMLPAAERQTDVYKRQAQALEALALCDTQAAYRRELQAQGVSSISLGKASESYQGVNSTASLKPLRSTEALLLLQPYLLGSGVIV